YFIPCYSELRVPARNMFVFNFVLSVLTSIGINYILRTINFSKSKMKTIFKLYFLPYLLFIFPFVLYFLFAKQLENLVSVLVEDLLLTFYFLGIFFVLSYLILCFPDKILRKMVFLAVFLVIEKFFLFFSNPYFNMNIQISQDYDKMIKNLAPKNNLDRHFLMLDSEEAFNLFAITTKQRVLNIYDPFVNLDYYYLFNIDWAGNVGSIYPLALPRNNLLLSIFGVNFITESQSTYINICKNLYKEENFQVTKLKEYQISQNKESTIIYFSNVNNSDLVVLNCKIKVPPLDINQKLRKMINESKEFLEINVQDMYKINLNLETIGNLKMEKGTIDFLIPLFLPYEQKIKIELKPFSYYREIKIENVDLYLYPNKKVLSITKNTENKVYDLVSENPIIYHNLNSMQNIFSVEKIKTVENIVEFKKMVLLSQFNPSQVAFVEKKELEKLKKYLRYPQYEFLGRQSIESIEFDKPNIEEVSFFEKVDKVELILSSNKPVFLVINNSYYDGWICKTNKIEVPVLKVNGIVQGIIVPPGKNSVTLEFNPWYKNFVPIPLLFFIFYVFLLVKISAIFIDKNQ
ncbi:MAG: hypothetical protein ACK4GJ_06735, partial [bacterium]